MREKFDTPSGQPWTDPDGLLELSKEQKQQLGKWARPAEWMKVSPKMIYLVSPMSITQTVPPRPIPLRVVRRGF